MQFASKFLAKQSFHVSSISLTIVSEVQDHFQSPLTKVSFSTLEENSLNVHSCVNSKELGKKKPTQLLHHP